MKLKLFNLFLLALLPHILAGQAIYLNIGSSIENHQLEFSAKDLEERAISSCISPTIGMTIRHTPRISSIWQYKRSRAFENKTIGDQFDYTFHFESLTTSLQLDLFPIGSNTLDAQFGMSADLLNEARQNGMSTSINLLESGFNKSGSSVLFGFGLHSTLNRPYSYRLSYVSARGLTNFENDPDQTTRFFSNRILIEALIRLDQKSEE